MTTTKPLQSGKRYLATFRHGVQGLEGDFGPGGMLPREFFPCRWQCRHGGVTTGESGAPNVDHGTVTVTMPDGTTYTGTYGATDTSMWVTID